ncbi:MAG TPA: tetratricopeptide repeat protein, partial [Myxococcaceae bacterium]|nr:tetratricopeptide repeat protein [Myxococcaceae bacterium]
MAKSLVERYEQLLAQDPASSVFVELAKALIAQGEPARAIPVCEQGISHHPQSVKGRVLWGKALIHLGRPAEAMAQFDQAIAIDKENPHAYNLIAEVLLQRGLYRSALPILRKALALQPNDGRVRGWMEQTQAALAGGPAPAFDDLGALEPEAEEEAAPEGGEQASAPAEAPVMEEEGRTPLALPPAELLSMTSGAEESTEAAPTPEPASEESSERDEDGLDIEDSEPDGSASEEVAGGAEPAAREEGEDAPRGEVASEEAPEELLPFDEEPPTVVESGAGGLLGELPPLEEEPAPAAALPGAGERGPILRPPPRELVTRLGGESGSRSGGLLEEIPELPEQEAEALVEEAAAPVPLRPAQDVGALASAYERELREKLLPRPAGPSFLSGRGLKIVAGVVSLLVLLGALVVVQVMRGGKALTEALDRIERLVAQDTPPAREEALSRLSQILELHEDNERAWVLTAYARALRYAEGSSAEDRAQALAALQHPGVREKHPGLAVAVDVLVADAKGRAAASGSLLKLQAESSEVHALAGSLLLEAGKTKEALARFEKALRLSPRNARALVRLAAYYRDAGDPVNALRVYETALMAAPAHPQARIGVAESRLLLGEALPASLAELEKLAGDEALPAPVRARQRLVQGRLLTALGRPAEARPLLTPETKGAL